MSRSQSHSKLRLLFTGFVMGSADVVPGVSGGTIALVMGIYENLLDAIASVNGKVVKDLLRLRFETLSTIPWGFIIPVGAGIGAAVLTLAKPLEHWMADPNSRIYLLALFSGLVLASAIAVGAKLPWGVATTTAGVLGGLVALVIVRLTPAQGSDSGIAFFLAGAVAICAMILPGISGSFILFILGQYQRALAAVSNLDLAELLVLGAGVVLGLATFVRLLRRLLARFYAPTMAAMVGFMIGSLWKVWPWRQCLAGEGTLCEREALFLPQFGSQLVTAAFLAAAGFAVVTVFDHWEGRRNPVAKLLGAAFHR